MNPARIQRSRAKGWRRPDDAVYVGRPSVWGNPFQLHGWRASFRAVMMDCSGDHDGRAQAAVQLYRMWLFGQERIATVADIKALTWFDREILTVEIKHRRPALATIKQDLAGRKLVCWCAVDAPFCHADVLLEIANG